MCSRKSFMLCLALSAMAIMGLGSVLNKAAAEKAVPGDLRQPVANVRDPRFKQAGDADDTPSIQRAIESLRATGGTAFFPPGTYHISQAVSPNEALPWCLLLRSNIDYVGVGRESKLLMAPGQQEFTSMMSTIAGAHTSETSRNITIRRLHFDGNRTNQNRTFEHQQAVFLAQVEDCRVEECLFHDTQGDAVYVHEGNASVSSQRVVVVDNEMHSLSRVGVNFAGASNSIARANFIHDTDNNAMKMEQDVGETPASGNQFIRNFARNAAGIALGSPGNRENVSDILIKDNTFDRIPFGPAIAVGEVSDVQVVGNIIIRAAGSGISVRSSQDVIIRDNQIMQTVFTERFDAVVTVSSDISGGTLPPSQRIVIEKNRIRDNPMTACKLRQSEDGAIKDNLILNNIGNISEFGPTFGIDLGASSRNTLVRGNTISGNGFAILVRDGASNNRFRKNDISAHTAGGIWIQSDAGVGNDFNVSTEANANCIRRNTAFGLRNDTAARVDARGNFWGCAAGPGNAGCDAVIGRVSFSPVLSSCPR